MPIHARAFYFQDAAGNGTALVSCELFAVSAGLRAEVLRLVNREVRLEPSALILTATHTHHGPANYASADAYNGFAGPLPNFDKAVFDFLAMRIARAVVKAIEDALAHAADNQEVLLYSGYAVGIQRNRAIAPFYRNDPHLIEQVQDASYSAGSRCPDGIGKNCPRYLSTDPALKVLEIRRGGRRRGLLSFYAVHPTAMSHDSELYSPDFTGVAVRALEGESGVIAGFFNGAEGDVSPDWDRQDRQDVLRLATKFQRAVVELLRTRPVQRSNQISITNKWYRAKQNTSPWKAAGFNAKPTPGAGEVGGAEDGRTLFYNYGFRGEARDEDAADPKLPALKQPLKDLADALGLGGFKSLLGFLGVYNKPDADSFPAEFPVGQLELGTVAKFAFIPVEATTLVGRAIRDAIGQDSIVLGLANEYYGYVVTRAEYNLQQYEGGSTELGPDEATGIVYLLTHAVSEQRAELVPAARFMPGKARDPQFGPDLPLLRVPRNMIDDDLDPLLPAAERRLESRIPRFNWDEDRKGDFNPQSRRVSVHLADGSLIAEDRTSTDLLTVFDGSHQAKKLGGTLQLVRTYAALWTAQGSPEDPTVYYFRVETGDGTTVCSELFTRKSLSVSAPVRPVSAVARCPN
jgi:neutral ceramidase